MSDDFHCDLTPVSSLGHGKEDRTLSSSASSDDMSFRSGRVLLSPPTSVSPNPVFIAASAASQIVTNDHENNVDSWFDQAGIEPSGETALVAPAALRLVNSFLDQLLYNFLAAARSTSLSVLRPAVREVLRPKLASEAIGGADEELHEYLGGGEDEELLAYHNGQEPTSEWDLDLVWKRTRLRCMVYSSLGDMEEEDEDLWTDKEELNISHAHDDSYNARNGVVSPAVAIFLTSILEFMGERALIVAGGTAYQRLRMTYETPERDGSSSPSEIADRVVVDELDVERVGLDRTLGRLWRGWKKGLRSTPSSPRQLSSRQTSSHYTSRRTSLGNETPEEDEDEEDIFVLPHLEPIDHEYAASIPLPLSENDVEEIETPWLKLYPDDVPVRPINHRLSSVRSIKRRPTSLMIFPSADRGLPTPEKSEPNSPMYRALVRSNSHTGYSPVTSTFKESKALKDTESSTLVSSEDTFTATDDESKSTKTNQDSVPIDVHAIAPAVVEHDVVPAVPVHEVAPVATAYDIVPVQEMNPIIVAPLETKDLAKVEDTIESDKEKDLPKSDSSPKEEKTDVSPLGFVAGAAALATAAVAGVVALATKSDPNAYDNDTDGEVPEIVMSSRVSLDTSRNGLVRHPSLRSISSHSLRVVDIPPRSRHNSMDATDFLKRVSSPISRAVTASPTMRHNTASPVNIARTRSAAAYRDLHERSSLDSRDSISEEEDEDIKLADAEDVESSVTPIPVPKKSPLREHAAHFPSRSIDASLASPVSPTSMTFENLSAFNATTPVREYGNPMNEQRTPTGVPALTPLRELVEGAADTSDEASSVTYSVDASKDRSIKNDSMEDIAPLRTTVIKTPPSVRDDDHTPTPETFSRNLKQVAATGSTTSQKIKPVRKSEDSAKSNGPSFEELMQSDKTIQYTLTPSSVRGIEFQKAPETTFRTSPVHSPSSSMHASQRLTGLNSNPTNLPKSATSSSMQLGERRSVSDIQRIPVVQPRDARVEPQGSVGDFADFIRTTGPSSEMYSPDMVTPTAPLTNFRDHGGMAIQQRNVSAPVTSKPATRVARSASIARLQARDAVVPYGGSSSELIDFIRQGPPSTRDNPRIPRTVAPFRTTMDSEQMVGAISRVMEPDVSNHGRNSQVSTATSMQQSLHNSISSQSALLNNYNPHSRQVQNEMQQNPFEDNMPKRKTRRVKDPYAIDYSDDEDGEINYIETDKPVRVEESLMDFLNAGPPGAGPQTSSVFDDVTPPAAVQQKTVQKKSSSTSLISRFSRKDSVSGSASFKERNQAKSKPSISSPFSNNQPSTYSNGYGTISSTSPNNNPEFISALNNDRKPSSQQSRVQQKQFTPRAAAVPISKYRSETDELADFLLNTAPTMAIGSEGVNGGQAAALKRQEAMMMQQQRQQEQARQAAVQSQSKSSGFSGMFGRKKKNIGATTTRV